MAYYISNIARSKGDPKILNSGPSSLGAADRLARALGWFSIGLGADGAVRARSASPGRLACRARKPWCGPTACARSGTACVSLSPDKHARIVEPRRRRRARHRHPDDGHAA